MADQQEPIHVLYLSYDGLTDPLGQSQILPYLRGLTAYGYRITIISFEKPERFTEGKERVAKLCKEKEINWVPLVYHKKPPVLSTLYDVFLLRKICKELLRNDAYQIVHCRSYITALIGLHLKRKHGVKFIFDMRGFWADERVEGGLWSLNNPLFRTIYQFFKRREKEMIREADTVVTLTESAHQEISKWNLDATISVIPCCVDLDLFNPGSIIKDQRNKIRSALKIGDTDFVLLYLGSLGTWYLYNEMVTFFRKLKAHRPNAKFLFLTPDADQVETDPDFIVRMVSRSEVPSYIAACDVSICFIKPSFSKKGSSATKMAEVLAMNIPVVTNAGWGDVAYLETQVSNLHVVKNENEQLVIKNILLPAKPQTDSFKALFSLNEGVRRYAEVYNS